MRDKQTRYARFQEILTWTEDWNGYRAMKPDPEAVAFAAGWLDHIEFLLLGNASSYRSVFSHWDDPSICPDPCDGSICCEWSSLYHKKLSISLYADGAIEYIRLYTRTVRDPMADGTVVDDRVFLKLWRWLHTPIPTRT